MFMFMLHFVLKGANIHVQSYKVLVLLLLSLGVLLLILFDFSCLAEKVELYAILVLPSYVQIKLTRNQQNNAKRNAHKIHMELQQNSPQVYNKVYTERFQKL